MAAISKMELMRSIPQTMTPTELREVEEQVADVDGRRFYRFTDLPAEVRNRIYRLAIQPSDVKFHVLHGICPALLKVSRQTNAEVQGLYYSHEYMNVEFYDCQTESWVQEKNTKLFPLILAYRHDCTTGRRCRYGHPREDSIAMAQSFESPLLSTCRADIFTWKGWPEDAEVPCDDLTDAIEREEQVRRYRARLM